MTNSRRIGYGSTKITNLVLYGSLCVSLVLTSFLVGNDICSGGLQTRSIVGIFVILYLLACIVLTIFNHRHIVSWLLIILYTALSFSTLLYWGTHAAAGIFASSFVIILTGVLLGSRAILPIAITLGILSLIVQVVHNFNIVTPDVSALYAQATYLDALSYVSILGVFTLITWLSNNQIEKTFERAKVAEATVRAQKELLTIELEKETKRLRETQLKELQQLYKFATLGQNVAATLHELSNHLSILNIDIEDLKQHHRNSRAIENAKESIEQINFMVRQIRRKLSTYDEPKSFKVGSVIRRVTKDLAEKSKNNSTTIIYKPEPHHTTKLTGDSLALIQILTILLANALDACADLPDAIVTIKLNYTKHALTIHVKDNGAGVSELAKETLFQPTPSTKPTGMGVGLYIARHLAESQFGGTVALRELSGTEPSGAHFVVAIPFKK